MSEYKRLTSKKEDRYWEQEEFWQSAEEPSYEQIEELYSRLAELEDKIENGQLVEIPEDSVVLSKEEQEKILTATESRINKLKEQVKQARKETTEKIFEILYQWLDLEEIEKDGFVTIQKFDFLRKFREIYKQFDVEIKE